MIYYVLAARELLFLMDIYAKSDKEDLTDADKATLRATIAKIKAEA